MPICDAEQREFQSMTNDRPQDARMLSAESDADADLGVL